MGHFKNLFIEKTTILDYESWANDSVDRRSKNIHRQPRFEVDNINRVGDLKGLPRNVFVKDYT